MFYNGANNVIAIRYAKGQKLKKEEFVQWNSFSRIAVRDYSIFIDADASTGIASFDFDTSPIGSGTNCWTRGRRCPMRCARALRR